MLHRFLPVLKIAAILFLTVLLLLPMARVRGLIQERQSLRDNVLEDVARSDAYAQTLTGPLLIVPYTRTLRETEYDRDQRPVTVTREVSDELRLLPELLDVAGQLATEERKRGIYRARVYRADAQLTGHFEIPANYGVTEDVESYRFGEPHLALGISDIRGIGNGLTLRTDGVDVPFQPGAATSVLPSGVHTPLQSADVTLPQRMNYEIALMLTGTGEFNVTPVGRETNVRLDSDWPHPAFVGEYLPRQRDISSSGFAAQWQTSFFATNLHELLTRCAEPGAEGCQAFHSRHFGVSFVDPVDHYLKSERAAKYAFLFIGLTFAGFFLTEVLRRVSVHPVQYGLVGLALAMFFLLLLSFSEHIGFAGAYAVSAAACVGLITFYVGHVLDSHAQGLGFGVGLASLYGLLYGILSSEDYALLMGSLLVFGLLAAVMVLTRRVSWSGMEVSR
ncbi:MAG TPA: cell envelope integrity protein CreD [Steroidobacteraceae bacterium]|nr:cell envelope integrity protein CreD [Steroidobacteraceae bacterium]